MIDVPSEGERRLRVCSSIYAVVHTYNWIYVQRFQDVHLATSHVTVLHVDDVSVIGNVSIHCIPAHARAHAPGKKGRTMGVVNREARSHQSHPHKTTPHPPPRNHRVRSYSTRRPSDSRMDFCPAAAISSGVAFGAGVRAAMQPVTTVPAESE